MTCDPEHPAPPADLWARARADYLAGHSAPVVAERYGLSERTVRRRAAVEGWRRADGSPLGDASLEFWSSRSREKRIEHFPQLEEVEQVTFAARFELLIDPDQKSLRRFAFRQAAEAAAMSRPAEAVVWMRLVQTLERTGGSHRSGGRTVPRAGLHPGGLSTGGRHSPRPRFPGQEGLSRGRFWQGWRPEFAKPCQTRWPLRPQLLPRSLCRAYHI